MISTAEDVATTWVFANFVGGKLQVVLNSGQILHLNHECWDPKSVHYIAGSQLKPN